MSLIHSITSTRAMALNLLTEDIEHVWPNGTRFSHHDITIGRQSLTETAQNRGTPSVLVTPLERPHSVAPSDRYRSLVVARILSISPRRSWLHPTEITTDCNLEALDSRVLDTVLLDNPNPWRRKPVVVRSQDGQLQLKVLLPASADRGHLVVFACAGALTLGQVDPKGLETPPTTPTQYAEEFRDDVALNRSREFMLVQFANDLGIHPGGLARLRFGQGLAYS